MQEDKDAMMRFLSSGQVQTVHEYGCTQYCTLHSTVGNTMLGVIT